jgi:hypothetical protein
MQMRPLLLLLVSISLSGRANAACDLHTDYSVKGEFNRSAYVGLVRVTGVTWLDEDRTPTKLRKPLMLGSIPGGFDPYAGANYQVESIRTFKGNLPATFSIFSENTEARTPLRIGVSYLVFLYRAKKSDDWDRRGDLMIDYCGMSAPIESAAPRIAIARRLAAAAHATP